MIFNLRSKLIEKEKAEKVALLLQSKCPSCRLLMEDHHYFREGKRHVGMRCMNPACDTFNLSWKKQCTSSTST